MMETEERPHDSKGQGSSADVNILVRANEKSRGPARAFFTAEARRRGDSRGEETRLRERRARRQRRKATNWGATPESRSFALPLALIFDDHELLVCDDMLFDLARILRYPRMQTRYLPTEAITTSY